MKFSKIKLKRVRPLMGTYVEVTLEASVTEDVLHRWITAGFGVVEEIDRQMSRFREDSVLSLLNRAKPWRWIHVSPHTARVLKASNEFFIASKGIFDIRCTTVPESAQPPVEITGTTVRKTGPWTFDLGGIAKGYAVDCAVDIIKRLSKGHRVSGIVNAGGDLRRWGPGAMSVAVATSAVRPKSESRLSPAKHVHMPGGKVLTGQKAVTVASGRCFVSDALTKIMLLASPSIAERCLAQYGAQALVQ